MAYFCYTFQETSVRDLTIIINLRAYAKAIAKTFHLKFRVQK